MRVKGGEAEAVSQCRQVEIYKSALCIPYLGLYFLNWQFPHDVYHSFSKIMKELRDPHGSMSISTDYLGSIFRIRK